MSVFRILKKAVSSNQSRLDGSFKYVRFVHNPTEVLRMLKRKPWKWVQPQRAAITLLAVTMGLVGCNTADTQSTPIPSVAPITPSPTIFFPTLIPTSTITPVPTGSPTPDAFAGLGDLTFKDDFTIDRGWTIAELAQGGASLSDDRLTLSVRQSNSLFMAISPSDQIRNAYLEVEVRPDLCSSNDEFGLAFRVNENFEHYRFILTCEGEARVVGVIESVERVLITNTSSTAIFPGLFLSNRLGVLMQGDTFRFFINDEEVFSDRDLSLVNGNVGLVVRARQSGQTTVSFDNFSIRMLQPSPISTTTE
jgi:hypothetical protein